MLSVVCFPPQILLCVYMSLLQFDFLLNDCQKQRILECGMNVMAARIASDKDIEHI